MAKGRLVFEVLSGSWTADGEEFKGGLHEVEEPSPELVKLASHAHSAGEVVVTEGLDESAIQSQEDGEAAYAAAQADGSWHEGNLVNHALTLAEVNERARAEALAALLEEKPDATREEIDEVVGAVTQRPVVHRVDPVDGASKELLVTTPGEIIAAFVRKIAEVETT